MSKEISSIEIRKVSDTSFVLAGKLGYKDVRQLNNLAVGLLNFTKNLSIDCSGLKYCDSAGLALLVNWLKSAKINNGSLCFINLTEQIRQMITLMNLDSLFWKSKDVRE